MAKMTDEELKEAGATDTERRLKAHIAEVTAERGEWEQRFRNADLEASRIVPERDALRERVRALEAENEARCAEMNAVRQRAVVLRAMNLRDVMSGEWNREAARLVHFILEDDARPSAPPEAFAHEKGLDAGVFDDAPHEFPCCGGSDEHPPQHTQDCDMRPAPPAAEPTTAEAFSTVRTYCAKWGDGDKPLTALSLLERRMGAMEAAARALIAGAKEGCIIVADVNALESALTDALPVFTLEEVESAFRNEANSLCPSYEWGRIAVRLTALRRTP